RALDSFPTRRSSDLDVRGVQEGAAKSSLPGEPSERCIGVGNGDELCAPAARLLPEVAVQAVGLLRRPGLARHEEQRARDVLASQDRKSTRLNSSHLG